MNEMKLFLKNNSAYIWLLVFAVAMGFLEAIVVVYLRQIYYPEGFGFPLSLLSLEMLSVEWIREFATLVMLASVGIIAGKNNLQRLCYFLFSFAIWDIFYYIALKLLLNWPPALLTWDILFLIPVPWIGPVLAPVICSFTMIFMSVSIINRQKTDVGIKIKPVEWVLLITGALTILCTFMNDYLNIILKSGILSGSLNRTENDQFWQTITQYMPVGYNWYVFVAGEIIIWVALALILRPKTKKNYKRKAHHSSVLHL